MTTRSRLAVGGFGRDFHRRPAPAHNDRRRGRRAELPVDECRDRAACRFREIGPHPRGFYMERCEPSTEFARQVRSAGDRRGRRFGQVCPHQDVAQGSDGRAHRIDTSRIGEYRRLYALSGPA
jgi:hypothetical protein